MKKFGISDGIVIILLILFLLMPLIATFIFSIATKWEATIMPQGITLNWYKAIFEDPRFLTASGRSLLISFISVAVSIAIMVPTIFAVVVYFKSFEKYLRMIVTIPFAIPGVVFAVGLIKIYSKGPFPLTGTIWILIGAYFVFVLPFIYQGIKNSLLALNAEVLMEAAEMLNASKLKAFMAVIVPNIMQGVLSAALLAFSVIFGEFVLTNFLAGGQFETVQIYMYTKRNENGHFTSAIVISYFIIILFISCFLSKVGSSSERFKIKG